MRALSGNFTSVLNFVDILFADPGLGYSACIGVLTFFLMIMITKITIKIAKLL